jgi:hypothetical protein
MALTGDTMFNVIPRGALLLSTRPGFSFWGHLIISDIQEEIEPPLDDKALFQVIPICRSEQLKIERSTSCGRAVSRDECLTSKLHVSWYLSHIVGIRNAKQKISIAVPSVCHFVHTLY